MSTATERAREACKAGYSIAESIYCRGLYEIRKPDGTKYTVDHSRHTCTCPAPSYVNCKHLALVAIALRYAATLERKQRQARAAATRARMDRDFVPSKILCRFCEKDASHGAMWATWDGYAHAECIQKARTERAA